MKRMFFAAICFLSITAILASAAVIQIFGINPVVLLCLISFFLGFSYLIAKTLKNKITQSIENIDLENPKDYDSYEEL
jgi:UPF0716 family protein affecting phage T7 exclusion